MHRLTSAFDVDEFIFAFGEDNLNEMQALAARDVVIIGIDAYVTAAAGAIDVLSTATLQPEGYLGSAFIIVTGAQAASSAGNYVYYSLYGQPYSASK